MALELGVFDLMPKDLSPFVRGFSSAFMATTLCYPLDTVRYASAILSHSSCLDLLTLPEDILLIERNVNLLGCLICDMACTPFA